MAYQALYRKYRPGTFSEVVGQDHITTTLKNELASGKVFHAYLFTGTRGTGKTSCAKILAKAVNCLNPKNGDPCGECENCKAIMSGEHTDISEIDAASNNGVDDIRTLREQINFLPASLKYRVYIIDEVHMLSDSAFNALLKTLEEPPAHIIFVLATTEVHKLPATILSRCQRFDFRRIENKFICQRINEVAKAEGFTVTDNAASLIAAAAEGGLRDALSILDLCLSHGNNIDEETVVSACALAGRDHLFALADSLLQKDTETALKLVDNLYSNGVDMVRLLNDLITHFRNLMVVKTVNDNRPIICSSEDMLKYENSAKEYSLSLIMSILKQLSNSLAGMQTGKKRLMLEMTVIKICENADNDYTSLLARIEALENGVPRAVLAPTQKAEVKNEPKEESIPTPRKDIGENDDGSLDCWGDILKEIATLCPPAIGVLNGSKAYVNDNMLLIDAPNPMFKSMINANAQMRDAIKKAAANVLGKTYRLGPYKKENSANSTDPLIALANKVKELNMPGGN